MGGWWGALWLCMFLIGTAATGSAWAQAAQPAESMSEARALFMAGRVAFDEGRYEAALKHFEASYEQSKRPLLLYNIAQCHDRMRRDEDALAAFERYLAVETDAELRASVEARVGALRAAVAARKEAAPAVDAAPATPAPARRMPDPAAKPELEHQRWWRSAGVVTAASGVVVALTGGLLMVLGSVHGRDVEQAPVGASYHGLQRDLDRADRQWIAGQALFGVGAAAVAGGLVWSLLVRPEKRSSVRLSLLPTRVGLVGQF